MANIQTHTRRQGLAFEYAEKDYRELMQGVYARLENRLPWFITDCTIILKNWQALIWKTYGGPEFNWINLAFQHGKPGTPRDPQSGLTLASLAARGLKTAHPSKIMNWNGNFKNGIRVLAFGNKYIKWGHPGKMYAIQDQMYNVVKGIYSENKRINIGGRWITALIPARPVVYANDSLADTLAHSFGEYLLPSSDRYGRFRRSVPGPLAGILSQSESSLGGHIEITPF